MKYNFTLEKFSGPLDLLLHLIQKAQVDIKDVIISEITTQYMEYINSSSLNALDMDSASDFLNVAATLLYIKSRSLLPKPKIQAQDEEQDEEQALLRQIQQYKIFKEASEDLQKALSEANKIFTRLPDEAAFPPPTINVVGMDIEALVAAFSKAIAPFEKPQLPEPKEVRLDEFKINDQICFIRNQLSGGKSIKFSKLFFDKKRNNHRMYLIVTFMALLEMICFGELEAVQDGSFEEIIIRKK